MANERGLRNKNIGRTIEAARVNIPGVKESIWQPLYDYQAVGPAAVANLSFFQVPIGQAGKTLVDTNMELAGQIPTAQNFAITGVQVEFYPGQTTTSATATAFTDDLYQFYRTGALILRIGSKEYIRQGNLMKFPPVNKLSLATSVGNLALQTNYGAADGREYETEELLLTSNQNFSVTLQGLPALPSGVAGRVGVTLNGYLFRNAQ